MNSSQQAKSVRKAIGCRRTDLRKGYSFPIEKFFQLICHIISLIHIILPFIDTYHSSSFSLIRRNASDDCPALSGYFCVFFLLPNFPICRKAGDACPALSGCDLIGKYIPNLVTLSIFWHCSIRALNS